MCEVYYWHVVLLIQILTVKHCGMGDWQWSQGSVWIYCYDWLRRYMIGREW